MDNKLLQNLSQNFLEILNDEEYYDITIEVGNDPSIKIFRAHMVILYYRSPYLRRILSTNKNKNDGILTHIKLPNILPETFQIILRYIYSGRIFLEEYDALDIIKVLVTACELGLQELIIYLQSFLIKEKANWMELNFNLIYKTSFENDSFLELQNYCTDLISKNPDKIFKSPDFSSIPEKLLITIIQNDNLQMSEIKVWEYVLKWGYTQSPELPSNPTNFSKEDFNILKSNLQHYIPFINFYKLTSLEFSEKVLPYKKILPKELYKDLLKYFLNPNNQSVDKINEVKKINSKNIDIDSKIITFKHSELISKWINRLEISSSYEFKLLLRGSRDGYTPQKFHKICDGKSHTVTIIKVKFSNEILGGYNPNSWKSDCSYSANEDSFIFSFKNNDNIEDHVLSRVKEKEYSTFNGSAFGPSFGYNDLILYGFNDNSYHYNICYEKNIRETMGNFIVEEYEVFQIIRN
ncbi:hypothetical protein RclHR1_01350006 [Rhizophagus clarus]|uniref:Carbohydrate-binding module family 13 protein n=1 Tax=Rhizophagus clarus TaxID=94130 RepID=A0A2Z6QQL6_9GLOM|nr:hypothetical protein RclHR1_01350006 [Rhizophagus clarus]GES98942.1 carbohydrate-binding module family 13 protein [Rhizophagus clarus]